jgi:hypothetical protein
LKTLRAAGGRGAKTSEVWETSEVCGGGRSGADLSAFQILSRLYTCVPIRLTSTEMSNISPSGILHVPSLQAQAVEVSNFIPEMNQLKTLLYNYPKHDEGFTAMDHHFPAEDKLDHSHED